ncbi:transcriptional regulator, TetR family [Clostridium cochlearium]|uniref:Transcriptional regulator, TetR family n=1 Tax=Clostridium cochlearium TaxID=1494 RepID=A0ABY0QIM1_CLOCO|nr:TetR/AcrR family transcriptional regulator [Clostridium cochlearium]SDK89132.1 transcriptional regulator, TetR family [Clostridium cochlearium]
MAKLIENPKDRIFQSAKAIAKDKGIAKVNIRLVAKDCGIAVGTIYNYFPKKKDLIVAIIEDFWSGVFAEINKNTVKNTDFLFQITEIYNCLYLYLSNFKENWIQQLSLLKSDEKMAGRKKEDEYFKKICGIIVKAIESDLQINQNIWMENFTKQQLAKFIFNNILIMLRSDEKDIEFFIECLKKIVYEK